ncbi:unnamed protein product [Caenorhabditis auriculariae]|uniref:Uncharacterized protein n=1 Tax=Caenorhabditis auriculariae TaxID=2777116 RepID=A0A8S1HME5_9PELO|nr:unnamed protein product [Caenorhabditis auriculariae]
MSRRLIKKNAKTRAAIEKSEKRKEFLEELMGKMKLDENRVEGQGSSDEISDARKKEILGWIGCFDSVNFPPGTETKETLLEFVHRQNFLYKVFKDEEQAKAKEQIIETYRSLNGQFVTSEELREYCDQVKEREEFEKRRGFREIKAESLVFRQQLTDWARKNGTVISSEEAEIIKKYAALLKQNMLFKELPDFSAFENLSNDIRKLLLNQCL